MPTRSLFRPLVILCAMLPAAAPAPAPAQSPEVAARIGRIERSLLPPVRIQGRTHTPDTLEERIRHQRVPAVSIALVHDGEIQWTRAYGVADVESGRAATPATLFQAASMSKPVAAMGALALVQEGKLALDEAVNDRLTSWKVPANELTAKAPVTLRGLLTHSAGLTVHGFPGYAAGAAVPTLVQVLDGAKPANTAAVRVDVQPGTRWRYAGGGTTVMQLLMQDVTGQPFPALMRARVLGPLGMEASTYQQPLPPVRAAQAATAYKPDGTPVPGRYHAYPEMAAAGLWTTPSDLARWIIGVQRALAGRSSAVLSRGTAAAMLTPGVGGWGLGPSLKGSGDSL
ncbi:MAG TPA: serine hydrolase domain-containing protein, partial [Longimicrobiaceae bacterium]|nr:serine hydrolase domain-containing protein [Longimicrobiaceae bacterium]